MALQPHTVECIFGTILAMALIIAATVISLLKALRGHLRGLDLSRLSIRGAYLQDVEMQDAKGIEYRPNPEDEKDDDDGDDADEATTRDQKSDEDRERERKEREKAREERRKSGSRS